MKTKISQTEKKRIKEIYINSIETFCIKYGMGGYEYIFEDYFDKYFNLIKKGTKLNNDNFYNDIDKEILEVVKDEIEANLPPFINLCDLMDNEKLNYHKDLRDDIFSIFKELKFELEKAIK